MDENTLTRVITSIARAMQPLAEAAGTTEGLIQLLDDVGINPTDHLSSSEFEDFRSALELALTPLENPSDVLQVVQNLPLIVDTLTQHLGSVLGATAESLLGALIVALLQREAPLAFGIFTFLGIASLDSLSPSLVSGRLRSKWTVNWERLPTLFSDPGALFEAAYGWGTEGFDPALLLRNTRNLFMLLGAPAAFQDGDQDSLRAASSADFPVLRIPVLVEDEGAAVIETGLAIIPTRNATNTFFDGLALAPFGVAQLSTTVELGDDWRLKAKGGLEAEGGFGLVLKSGGDLSLQLLDGSTSDVSIALRVGVEKSSASGSVLLFGDPESSRLEVTSVGLSAGAEVLLAADPEFKFEASAREGRLLISTRGGDAFVSETLALDLKAPFDVTIGWSNLQGVYFQGSAGLEITIPVHAEVGPLELQVLYISAVFESNPPALLLTLGVDVGLQLGPLAGAISRIGAQLKILISQTPDFALSFLPPTGAGFSITGVVTGGGFLEFDDENERYAGILALECMGIGITAIGLITTKMPDGSKGFSMLVNIGITFNPPIQISMGFTLSGVGGLIGINRTMVIDVLREGIRKGTLDSILFPDPAWVIPNAAKVISDLRAVFAPAEGRFIIGPMVQIGYGTPNFVIGELGVFLELPDPPRIVLLGQVSMSLPTPEAQIVGVNIDIVGVLDFQKQELSFQASINASSLMVFELFGDCAFFLRWGNQSEVAFAIGGFHPKFPVPAPPSIFAGMSRLGVNINYGPVIQLGVGGYLAVTPNSLQLGARVEVFIGIKSLDLGIGGFISFDGLIYFSPFFFDVAIEGGMSVSVGSISLADLRVFFNLSGPTPWNVRGRAVIKILFIDIDVGFDVTWGRSDAAMLPPIDPWPELERALLRAESWGSKLPAASSMVETFASLDEGDETADAGADGEDAPVKPVIVHPAGILEIRQNVAPLDLTLQKFANAPVAGHDHFRVAKVSTGPVDLSVESVDEHFARGQFQELSNAQKLSVPSFEKLPGGVATKRSGHLSIQGDVRSEPMGYESVLIKPDRTSQEPEADSRVHADAKWAHMRFLSRGNASRRGALRSQGQARFARSGERLVGTFEERYVVATADALVRRAEIGEQGMTRSQAEQALERYLIEHPTERGTLVVVSEFELDQEAA